MSTCAVGHLTAGAKDAEFSFLICFPLRGRKTNDNKSSPIQPYFSQVCFFICPAIILIAITL